MSEQLKTYAEIAAEAGPYDDFRMIDISVADAIATITMQDPDSPNAYSPRFCGELRRALSQVENDPAVAVVILTGTGKVFTAGGDVRQMQDLQMAPLETFEFIRHEFGGIVLTIAGMDKPVIAAVNGYAMGVGFFTALACDMIVASEQAAFGTAYIRLGLTPLGVGHILSRSIGYHRAFELCALGDQLSAADAKAMGLVNHVTSHAQLMEKARELAERLAAGAPRALGFCKQFLRKAVQADLEDHLLMGEAMQPLLLFSDDHHEAVAAFLEKRQPRYSGR